MYIYIYIYIYIYYMPASRRSASVVSAYPAWPRPMDIYLSIYLSICLSIYIYLYIHICTCIYTYSIYQESID